ncbi:TPA: hypothetical protein ACU9OW_002637 [Legionella pneumophila]
MNKRDLVLADITKRLIMMPKGLIEAIIILRHHATTEALNSAKRWATMIESTLSEYEEAFHSKEGY